MPNSTPDASRARELAARVEVFVREEVVPYERDPRWNGHGPADALVVELRNLARAAGLLTPHILPDGGHLTHRETALVFRSAGLSPLGPVALTSRRQTKGTCFC